MVFFLWGERTTVPENIQDYHAPVANIPELETSSGNVCFFMSAFRIRLPESISSGSSESIVPAPWADSRDLTLAAKHSSEREAGGEY